MAYSRSVDERVESGQRQATHRNQELKLIRTELQNRAMSTVGMTDFYLFHREALQDLVQLKPLMMKADFALLLIEISWASPSQYYRFHGRDEMLQWNGGRSAALQAKIPQT